MVGPTGFTRKDGIGARRAPCALYNAHRPRMPHRPVSCMQSIWCWRAVSSLVHALGSIDDSGCRAITCHCVACATNQNCVATRIVRTRSCVGCRVVCSVCVVFCGRQGLRYSCTALARSIEHGVQWGACCALIEQESGRVDSVNGVRSSLLCICAWH